MTIFKGDNTAAFGNNFLTINITQPDGYTISKAEIKIGLITKTFENPSFPLSINLTEEETKKLSQNNTIFMAVWDDQDRKLTCEGTVCFKAREEVV